MRDISTNNAPYLTDGVLGRRLLAWAIDAVLCGLVSAALALALFFFGLLTFGLGWYLYALMWLVPIAYTYLCVASAAQATPGQRAVGLVVVADLDLGSPNGAQALVYAVGFWATLAAAGPLLLVSLVTARSRCLHDIISGLVVIRADSPQP